MEQKNVIVEGSNVYLRVDKEWYVYDAHSTPIGGGAMGIVFLGRSYPDGGQRVAIKQVYPQYAEIPSIRERARIEGSLRFNHTYLIKMVGCCEYDPVNNKGPLWIISHLVQGKNLNEHVEENLRKDSHAVKKIIEAFFPVLDALQYLHEGYILHLDIKPSNIMYENGCHVRLMDLGIAAVGSTDHGDTVGMLGTPKYAAPEQWTGKDQKSIDVSPSTDVYQTAVSLYELLTQYNPYDAPTVHQMMELHRTMSLPQVPELPKEIYPVLKKATDPIPKNRYQSAQDFKKDLREALRRYESRPKIPIWAWIVGSIIILFCFIFIFIYVRTVTA